MSITINANGTSVPFFKIGKTGVTFYQGAADPTLSYTVNQGDYWYNTSDNSLEVMGASDWEAPKLADLRFVDNSILAPSGQDLILAVDEDQSVTIGGAGSGPSLITTSDDKDLHINPAVGGGQHLILNANRWPTTDGTNGQALVTDGSGVLSFATISASSSSYQGQVADQSAMLALPGIVVGDYAFRQDTGTNWQCNALPSSTLSNWVNLGFDSADVLPIYLDTVNNRIGINESTPLETLDVGVGNILMRQIPVPTSAPTLAAAAGGSVDIGQHHYSTSYVTPLGDTARSLQTSTITISSGNQTVNLTNIPISPDPSVTGRKLYRSKAGESSRIQYFLTTINDNVTTTYSDTVADSTLTVLAKNVSRSGGVIFQRQGSVTRPIIQIDETTTSIGDRTNTNGTGYNITSVGVQQLQFNTSGYDLCAIGNLALNANTSGQSNNAFGVQALFANTTGSSNTAIGKAALGTQVTASSNVALGVNAGSGLNTGSFNTFIGPSAGSGVAFSSSNNIFIGSSAGTGVLQSSSVTNSIAIGKLSATPRSNMAVIGDNLVVETQLRGSVRLSISDTSLPAPDTNVVLDMGSITTKGVLMPLVSTATRDGMTTPSAGILLYNSTTGKMNIRTSIWEEIISGGGWASQVEAEAGSNNTNAMTPLRTKQAIDYQLPTILEDRLFGFAGYTGDIVTSTTRTGSQLNTFKVNGITWTYLYSGIVPTNIRAFGSTLNIDLSANAYGDYVADPATNILIHGGAPKMTWATAAALGDAIVSGTYVSGTDFEPGFRIFVTDINDGTELEWSTSVNWWRGIGGAPILIGTALNEGPFWTGSTTESSARATFTVPGKLVAANNGQVASYCILEADNGTVNTAAAGAITPRWKYASTTYSSNGTGAGVRRLQTSGVLNWLGARNLQWAVLSGAVYTASSTSNMVDMAVDSSVDQTVTVTFQLATSTDRVKYRSLRVWVQN